MTQRRVIVFAYFLLILVLLGFLLYFQIEKQNVRYQIIDLGPCGLWDAWDLNDHGQMVTTKRPPGEIWSTSLIEPDGTRTELKLDTRYVFASDINNRGEVVGYTRDKKVSKTQDLRGFQWSASDGFSFTAEMSVISGTNDETDLVGISYDMEDKRFPSLQRKEGGISRFDDELGQVNSSLKDINNQGAFIGSGYIEGKGHIARVWSATGAVTEIPPLGNHGIFVNSINDHGEVLCSSSDLSDLKNAWLGMVDWIKSGFKKDLELNAYRSGVEKRFIIWCDGSFEFIDEALPSFSGWKLHWMQGINNEGEIIGTGTYRGDPHAFLLRPLGRETSQSPPKDPVG